MCSTAQLTYFDFCRQNNKHKERLNRLWHEEYMMNLNWIKKRYPHAGKDSELSLLEIAWALQLDYDNIKDPEMIVRYFLREKKLKGRKISDIAEYMVLRDIKEDTHRDINDFKEFEKRVRYHINSKTRIPHAQIAKELDVTVESVRAYVRKVKYAKKSKKSERITKRKKVHK